MLSPIGYATNIGRVGALAVALGIGAAVATGHGIGVARADTGADAADSSTNAPSASPLSGTTPEAVSGDPTGEPTLTSGSDSSEASRTDSGPSVPKMNLTASGGEDNSVNDAGQITDAAKEDDELERGTTSTPIPNPGQIPIVDAVSVPETPPAHDISSVKPSAPAAHKSADAPRSNPQAANDIKGDSPGFQKPSSTGVPAWASLKVLPDNGDAADLGDQRHLPVTTDGAELGTTRTSLTMQASEDPPVGVPGSLAGVTTTLVGLLLSPFLAPGPAAPAEPPLLWAVLAWVRREVQRSEDVRTAMTTVENDTETMAFSLSSEAAGLNPTYTVGTPDIDGVVTGVVTATQILDYPLVFSGSTELPTGLAIVNGDGTFTYTPYPWARLAATAADASETRADQQSFTVTVDDFNGDVASVLVTVPVSPSSDPYGLEPTFTAGTPDGDGVVTGVISVGSPTWMEYPLAYEGPAYTTKGVVVVNPDGCGSSCSYSHDHLVMAGRTRCNSSGASYRD
jgi:hypothetical protein